MQCQRKWKQTGQPFLFWGNLKKREDSRRCISMNAWLESCKLYIFANFIYYTFRWWLLLLYTIFFVASTSPAKYYSRPWFCSWLFSEETLWVACEKLFLEVLDFNNNNNNNNDNNNKDLFATSIFTMVVRAIEKTIKMNKNVKIYQYITVNTKDVTTKM